MSLAIITQPVSLTAVPGQDSTFTVAVSTAATPLSSASFTYQWYLSGAPVTSATSASYVLDPLIGDNGKAIFARVALLTAASLTATATFVTMVTSNSVTITVAEDVVPFNTYDLGSETGRQRHLRLRLLGYI